MMTMARTASHNSLPDYDRPPVVETVLGVQFERLTAFHNAHLGAYWKSLDNDVWTRVADAPLLASQFERFTETAQWSRGVQLQLTQDPACRLQISNASGDRMIQVQNGRLHFNWVGTGGGGYPRYASVRKGFVEVLDLFEKHIVDEKLGDFRPNQWEVTYVNHIAKGTVWNTPRDWNFFSPLASLPRFEGVVDGESFQGEWHFVIPERRGRLHVQWQHGVKASPGLQEMIVLTLTARGPLGDEVVGGAANDRQKVLEGLDSGRETIVRFFRHAMSRSANEYWGLNDVDD